MEQKSYIFLPDADPVRLRCPAFGYEYASPGMTWGPAARNYYVVHYVFSGKGVLYTDSDAHPVSKGQLFVIFPDETVMYVADEKDPWYYCFANFQTTAKPFAEGQHCYTDSRLGTIFQNILLLAQQNVNDHCAVCAELLNLFSILSEPSNRACAQQYVDSALSYIHDFYNRQIRIGDLAQYINIDRGYLYSLFRKYLGVSPKEYLTNYRMESAVKLLTQRRMSIKEVSVACGYVDVYSFTKAFKKHYGCDPGQYIHNR